MGSSSKVALGGALGVFTLGLAGLLAVSCVTLDSNEKTACETDSDCLNGYSCLDDTCKRAVGDCPTGEKLCDGACVSMLDPVHGCGQEACEPCDVGGGAAVCDTLFRCRADQCDAGFKECGGQCVPVDDPATGCSAAGCEPCPADAICTLEGACGRSACPEGTKLCDAQCVSKDDPATGCASDSCDPCSIPNAGSYECDDGGACVVTSCANSAKMCDGECVSVRDPAFGCAAPSSCAPCFGTNVAAEGWTCSTSGLCVITSCAATHFRDCDGVPFNGCESDVRTNLNNCGMCGKICQAKDGTASIECVASNCQVGTCIEGRYDCDHVYLNGCESTSPCS